MASGKDAQLDLSDLEAYRRQQPSPVTIPAYISTTQSPPNDVTSPLQG